MTILGGVSGMEVGGGVSGTIFLGLFWLTGVLVQNPSGVSSSSLVGSNTILLCALEESEDVLYGGVGGGSHEESVGGFNSDEVDEVHESLDILLVPLYPLELTREDSPSS